VVFGVTDEVTVKLDFDDTPFRWVKYWASRACNWFDLGGYIILKSSKKSYHIVFDRAVDWRTNMHILCWVAVEANNWRLKNYVLMQGIKECSTLRVGPKLEKPPPRIVYRFGDQGGEIARFLEMRGRAKRIVREMSAE
jgi:hypothetical protein